MLNSRQFVIQYTAFDDVPARNYAVFCTWEDPRTFGITIVPVDSGVTVYDATPVITGTNLPSIYAGDQSGTVSLVISGHDLGISGQLTFSQSGASCDPNHSDITYDPNRVTWSPDQIQVSIKALPCASGIYGVTLVSNGASGNGFLAQGSQSGSVTFPSALAAVPPPSLQITSEGQPLQSGACAHITKDPRMPALSFSLRPNTSTPLFGNVKWSLSIGWTRPDGKTDLQVNESLTQVAISAPWTPQFADDHSDLQGGTATIGWTYSVFSQFTSSFCIDGQNQDVTPVKSYVAGINSYWDIPKLIAQESSYLQFRNRTPITTSAPPYGYGLMQLTNPAPNSPQIWNWQSNVQGGLSLFASNQAASNLSGRRK